METYYAEAVAGRAIWFVFDRHYLWWFMFVLVRSVRYVNEQRGKVVFASRGVVKGEILFTEKPYVAMQHVDSQVRALLQY